MKIPEIRTTRRDLRKTTAEKPCPVKGKKRQLPAKTLFDGERLKNNKAKYRPKIP
ncbi:MAG: hypothetical protein ABII64_02010 [Elusimicrobiota bacterium]